MIKRERIKSEESEREREREREESTRARDYSLLYTEHIRCIISRRNDELHRRRHSRADVCVCVQARESSRIRYEDFSYELGNLGNCGKFGIVTLAVIISFMLGQ